jgi:hypothetical protein
MTYIRPKFRHPDLPKNDLGYTTREYEGSLSTYVPAADMTRSAEVYFRLVLSYRFLRTVLPNYQVLDAPQRRQTISLEIHMVLTQFTEECLR